MCELPSVTTISVSGEQRHEYLHGQITVNTQSFDACKARIAAHCDFKGKMFSAMTVCEHKDELWLNMESGAAQESVAQLNKYGVFAKVDIQNRDDLHSFGVYGNDNIAKLSNIFGNLSTDHLAVSACDKGVAICFVHEEPRYLCILNEAGSSAFSKTFTDFSSQDLWQRLEILSGLANVQKETLGQFVPQMLNFQSIDAIDFDKGCYMGQEVVARTKFLGRNKRACFIATGEIKDDVNLNIGCGEDIEIQIGDNWRRSGIVNRATIINNKIYALLVCSNDTAPGTVLRLKQSQIPLTVGSLPYSIE